MSIEIIITTGIQRIVIENGTGESEKPITAIFLGKNTDYVPSVCGRKGLFNMIYDETPTTHIFVEL